MSLRDELEALRTTAGVVDTSERGAVLVCGGLGGAMEAACRGAKAAGGNMSWDVPANSK